MQSSREGTMNNESPAHLELEVFISELGSVDTFTACSVSTCKVTTLAHKARYYLGRDGCIFWMRIRSRLLSKLHLPNRSISKRTL